MWYNSLSPNQWQPARITFSGYPTSHTTSEEYHMKLIKDIGLIFASEKSKQKTRHAIYECPICKKHFTANVNNVNYGKTTKCRKCGSSNRGGISSHFKYHTWGCQKNRCRSIYAKGYENYGGRGIQFNSDFDIFEDWLQYVESLPNAFKEGYTIDRIDNDGNYEKGNLRWASKSTQSLNRRKKSNATSEYRGVFFRKETKKWVSSISHNGKKIILGNFVQEKEAAIAYNDYVIANKTSHIKNFL